MPVPDITVVVPTRDRHDQLRRCLASLLAQEVPAGSSFDVVVVDDGSVPPVELPWVDARVTVTRQSQGGPASARNAGALATQAPLVAFLDDDCEPAPGWLAALIAAAHAAPGCGYGGRVVNRLAANPFAETSQLIVSFLCEYYRETRDTGRFFTSNNLAVFIKRRALNFLTMRRA